MPLRAKSQEYRQHSGECRALARAAQNDEHRNQLIKMAEAWDNFAQEAERSERAKDRLKDGSP